VVIYNKKILRQIAILFLSVWTTSLFSQNKIVTENLKPATPQWWLANPATDHEIEGYASATSVLLGNKITFFVNTASPSYTWEVTRLGWYSGGGGRRVLGPATLKGQAQNPCNVDPTTSLVECQWSQSFTIDTSAHTDWISGVYVVKLTEITEGKDSFISFVLREDSRATDFVFARSVTTEAAYNPWGDHNLYNGAVKVSFNRPQLPPDFAPDQWPVGTGYLFSYYDYNLVRWMEKSGYDLKYVTSMDLHENYNTIANSKIYLSVGHDEYWSMPMRNNLAQFRDSGKHVAFFSSNTMYWQVRFEPDSSGNSDRTMVCYKDSDTDPVQDLTAKTVRFRDAPLNNPEDGFIGVMMDGDYPTVNNHIVIRDASHWLFQNTGLVDGDKLPYMLGYEVDRMHWSAPASLKRLGKSTYEGPGGGPSFSDMTLYRAQSGALVFATGSMQWIWGLDDYQLSTQTSRNFMLGTVQGITQNLFTEMLHPHYEVTAYPVDDLLINLLFKDPVGSTHFKDSSTYNRSVLCTIGKCPLLFKDYDMGTALHFANYNSYLDLGVEPSIRGQQGFKIEFAINVDQIGAGSVIIQQRDELDSDEFLGYDGSYEVALLPDGRLNFWTFSNENGYSINMTSTDPITDGNWHDIVVGRRADGTGMISIDEVFEPIVTPTTIDNLKPHTVFLGYDPVGPYQGFIGRLAQLKITLLN